MEEVGLNDEAIETLEQFCASIRDDLDTIRESSEAKKMVFEWLNLRARLLVEGEERVMYVSGRIIVGEKRISMTSTKPKNRISATIFHSL